MKNKKEYIGFLTVDYDDFDASSYKGLNLSIDDNIKQFNSGDPLIDWYDYYRYIYDGGLERDGISFITHSSNVDHWFMDSDEYIEKYIKYIDGKYDFISDEDVDNGIRL